MDWNSTNLGGGHNYNSIFWTPVTESEITSFLKNIKENTAYFVNSISNNILKNIGDVIAFPLSILFNRCFASGIFPNLLKRSLIIPLFKNSDVKLCNNYRPIALALTISKIFEKYINTRLIKFLDKSKFFSNNQFGFRK